jgi:hypothetical protein
VERAAQPAVLTPGKRQIGAAVLTMLVQQAVASGVVAEQHQVLAQQANTFDGARRVEFLGQRGRLPVPAHQRTTRRTGTGSRDHFVLFGGKHRGASDPRVGPRLLHETPLARQSPLSGRQVRRGDKEPAANGLQRVVLALQ